MPPWLISSAEIDATGTRPVARLLGDRSGVMAVELALLLPVILVMMMGAYEFSSAISNQMAIQNATRASTQYALTKPPIQGDLQEVVEAAKQAMPSDWTDAQNAHAAQISASLTCECSLTGQVACTAQCTTGEEKLTYLNVSITKVHDFLFDFPGLIPSVDLADTAVVRLK